jgi:hypothetical protein
MSAWRRSTSSIKKTLANPSSASKWLKLVDAAAAKVAAAAVEVAGAAPEAAVAEAAAAEAAEAAAACVRR